MCVTLECMFAWVLHLKSIEINLYYKKNNYFVIIILYFEKTTEGKQIMIQNEIRIDS